ncbi:hypothetical protein [Cyclobacterium jeungdonense]|uniref:Lipoprotein n=1 Tax=Cyclobacterium jeungdonense TaxID=708087 RepID=A0ABT8C4M9_9BACT|nr:hypothetical protein [Cyclobacterium jeungdonense]MDN3687261.1 hypothetical protein [Cyclobacterium jeungdonense]
MKTVWIYFLLSSLFIGCKEEIELPFRIFEIKMNRQVFGNFLRFEVLSDPDIPKSDLTFFIGNLEVFPEKTEYGEWVLHLEGYPAGTHQLKVMQKSNPKNSKISNFEKAGFLLELAVDPSLMEDGVRHHLIVWNEAGQTVWVEELTQAGNYRVALGSYESDHFSMGIFTEFEDFSQGLGQVFDQVPLGNYFPLNVEKKDLPPFGTATLKFQQIPAHQEYWIGSRGSFSHGQTLSSTLPLFLDVIPTRFFVRVKHGQKTYASFFAEEATFSGAQVNLNLGAMDLMTPHTINFSKAISGSYSVYGFESAIDLQTQIPLELGSLNDLQQLDIVNYGTLYPKVEFQLNFAEEGFQSFSRHRAARFPTSVQIFDADFSIQNEDKLTIKGTVDLVFSTWSGMDSNGTDWLIFRVQGPDQTRLQAPLISSERINLKDVSLRSVALEESDLLENYSDFIADFSQGKNKDYFLKSSRFHSKSKPLTSARTLKNEQVLESFSKFSYTHQFLK